MTRKFEVEIVFDEHKLDDDQLRRLEAQLTKHELEKLIERELDSPADVFVTAS